MTTDEMSTYAKSLHALSMRPEPEQTEWRCVVLHLSRVPTEEEAKAFREAWIAEHARWTDLLTTHVPDRKETP